ncbi:FAD-dependent oxidoreductase [Acidimicrobiia bacterium EGI L10123]|uniref:FAD-dependent oxidoreductase n=1 Tax=Salinilacustrithrix flava TaxID=2957203 RepID=UPI003D7C2D8C|nr:FAD-dependent oxidoreductase [Acidimicrobiia bacterium EGI L10123]
MQDHREIHIIGGGLAGLTAAAFAARAGASVVVHESRQRLGGRATTDEREGFRFDQGPHALYLGGPAIGALRDLGIDPAGVTPSRLGTLVRDGVVHDAPTTPGTFLSTSVLGVRDKLELGRVLAGIVRQRAADHAHRTVEEWADDMTRRPAVRQVLDALVRLATYANHPETMSADLAVRLLQQASGPGVRYVDGGWQVLVDQLASVATAAGARIEHGAVRSEVPDAAAVIVAAGGPATAAALLDVEWSVGPAAEASCLDLGLRGRPPVPFALGVDEPLYASEHSIAGGRAPEGSSVLAVAEYLGADAEPDRERLERYVRTIGVPDDDIVVERYLHRMVVSTAIPVAAGGGMAGRPGTEVPGRPGAFVAGDWVGPEGNLSDAAIASARAAALAAVRHVERLPVVG